MAALMPKSLSRGSPPKAPPGPTEPSESAVSEAPGSRAESSTAMAPATAHEAAVATDSSRGVDHRVPAEQAPAFAARQEVEAAPDRNNLAEATSSAKVAQQQQQQGHNVEDRAVSEPRPMQPASELSENVSTQHELAAAQDREDPVEPASAGTFQRQGLSSRTSAPQPDPGAPQLAPEPVAFAAPREIAAAQNRQFPTQYTAAAMGKAQSEDVDSGESTPETGPSQPDPRPAGSQRLPEASGRSTERSQQDGLPGAIEVAAPVNGLRRDAAEPGAQDANPPDDGRSPEPTRSPVKFGRPLPGMVHPGNSAQDRSVAGAAERTSSPSKRQPLTREPVQSSSPAKGRMDTGSQREGPGAQRVDPSAAGNGGDAGESGSAVKFGRPLPGMAPSSSFAQGGTTLNGPQQPSSGLNPPSPAQSREASSSQPALSMRPDETHQQLSEPTASSGLSGISAPGNDFSQPREQPPSGDSNSSPSSSSSIGQQSQAGPGRGQGSIEQQGSPPGGIGAGNSVQQAGEHSDAGASRQPHEAGGYFTAAQQGSPAKMRLPQSQPDASAFNSKQLSGDGAPSREDPPATIKAKHPDGVGSQGPHRGSTFPQARVDSNAAEAPASNDMTGGVIDALASSSRASAQQVNEESSAQDNRSFRDAHLAIQRASTSGQGSIAEAASQRAKPPITRSACFACC